MNLLKTTPTSAAVRAPTLRREVEQHAKQQMQQGDKDQPQEGMMPALRDKVSNVLDSSMILSPQWLGNVAANYMPARPPAFVPVIVQKVRRKKGAAAAQKPTVDDSENGAAPSAERDGGDDNKNLAATASAVVGPDEDVVIVQPSIDLPAVTTHSLPSLEIAAPARNLCLELLSTRIVAVVRTVSLLLQEFSSSPGQSLPHVALIGSGNVGHTILAHLVRLLPPDRIVALARDEKSDTCMHFASKFGVRSLSTNILRDERLVDVVRSHRKERTATDAASGAGHRAVDRTRNFGGDAGAGAAAAASHVAPEVAAAHNISVALQQVHVLIVACRPSQLGEVASSLQPWLRSSAVTVVSALAGVSADRVAALFRVPSSISATVDTNEMLFSFESASFLNARMATDSAITAAAAAAAQQQLLEAAAAASSVRAASEFGDAGFAAASSSYRGDGAANNNNNSGVKNKTSGVPFRFFAKDPMDFLHRLFFALVTTLLERCGVQPSAAWVGAAKLLLGRPLLSPPVVGAQGPGLVAKCSVQHLAAASGLSVGEVLSTVDARLASFAGIVTQQ